MLSTFVPEIALIFAGVALLISLGSAFVSSRGWRYSRAAYRFIQEKNERSQSLSAIAEMSAQLTELSDSYHALLASHKKLRSRIGMREIREKRQNGRDPDPTIDGLPDPQTDPEGWKAAMRVKLRTGQIK